MVSDKIKYRVEQKVEQCLRILGEFYNTKFNMPKIVYEIDSEFKETTGAHVVFEDWELHFNPILLVDNLEDFIKDIIPHEVAHLADLKINGVKEDTKNRRLFHGTSWRKAMEALGVPANTYHTFDTSSIKPKKSVSYEYKCDKCGKLKYLSPIGYFKTDPDDLLAHEKCPKKGNFKFIQKHGKTKKAEKID